MTELLDTSGLMRAPRVEDEKGGSMTVRGDQQKRRSTEEVTSGELDHKRTKHSLDANTAGDNRNRWQKRNQNRRRRNSEKPSTMAVNPNANTNGNGSKHRRGNRYKRKKHFARKQSKLSQQTSPGGVFNELSNKSKSMQRKHTLTNNAPFNSTQFLMNDHGGDTLQYLDSTLGVLQKEANSAASSVRGEARPVRKINRARDSSFSLDSDEDFYYSSPEDEEEFVNQEFIKEYNNVRTNRLVDMSKADLIQEYLLMENRVDNLEKRLNFFKDNPNLDTPPDTSPENSATNSEVAEKIKNFQRKIVRLEEENQRLRQMMQEHGSEPTVEDVDEINHYTINEDLMDDAHSDNDSISSCPTCNGSSSSSSSSSSRSTSSLHEDMENGPNTESEGKCLEMDATLDSIAAGNPTINEQNVHRNSTLNSKSTVSEAELEDEHSEEIDADENKENSAIVECSEQVSENLVSSTAP